MGSFKLALQFVRIPRLFFSLLFFPLLIGLGIVYVQALVTGIALKGFQRNSSTVEHFFREQQEFNIGRFILYGEGGLRPSIQVCRWIEQQGDTAARIEVPPTSECQPDRLDVALQVLDPAAFDPTQYVQAFQGNVERLHLCRSCHPDIIIDLTGAAPRTRLTSVWAFILVNLLNYHPELGQQYVAVMKGYDDMMALLGKNYLELPGFNSVVPLSELVPVMLLIINIAAVVVIALWLALKAHRKVLDYFAYSGVLLPMVAAIGKQRFYGAIWALTLLRVGAFLLGAIPFLIISLADFVKMDSVRVALGDNILTFAIWLLAIVAGLAFATLVGSVADLKHRFHLLSFAYRYVPLILCIIGAFVWAFTFLFEGATAHLVRSITAGTPILGIAPILVAPLFKPGTMVILIHMLLTTGLLILALRSNARWFAAHLEDL